VAGRDRLAAPRREQKAGGRSRAGWLPQRVAPCLAVTDLASVGAACLLVSVGGWSDAVVMAASVLVVMAGLGTYRSRLTLSLLDDLPAVALAALVSGVAELAWLTLHAADPPGTVLLHSVAAVAGLLAASRALALVAIRHAREIGLVEHGTLILGAGAVGHQIAATLETHPEYGLRLVGMVDLTPDLDRGASDVPYLGTFDELPRVIREHRVSEVIVAFTRDDDPAPTTGTHDDTDLVDAVRACDRLGCEIFLVPRFHELHHRSRAMDELWGIPLVRARRAAWRSAAWQVKRVLDVVMAGLALVLLAPVLLAVAVAVRWEVGPQVLFRQVRVGLDDRPFTLLKFRSLRPPEGCDDAPVWSISADARLGPVGRMIRATSLDELPQLINILRGEMSFVGPRPERPRFVEEFSRDVPRYAARHRAPAGLTGWAQVNGLRGDTSIEERVRFDNFYIQNWSLWLDVKILVRTVAAVLLRRGS
jgi:exopolysaccharide biosynthesis polyprenyl glycosylphosphotransferase